MNKVFLIGNLTRDPEMSETSSGIPFCRLGIAVNRPYSGSDGERATDFFNVTVWRTQAENCGRYLKKGSKVSLVASLQNRSYEDKDGNKRKSVQVVASNVSFCGSKAESGTTGANSNPAFAQPAPSYASADNSDFEEIVDDDDDLPF